MSRNDEEAERLRLKLAMQAQQYAQNAARPSMQLPENMDDLLDQRREKLARGGKLSGFGEVREWLLPQFRSAAAALLRKAERGSGGLVSDAVGAVREKLTEDKGAPRRQILSDLHRRQLEEAYRKAREMQSIVAAPTPQAASLLAVELTMLGDEIVRAYGPEALPELCLVQELAAELLVPLMQWQYDNGYVERPDQWMKMGRPHMGRIVPMGTPTIQGEVYDQLGRHAEASAEEQARGPSHAAFTSEAVRAASDPNRNLPAPQPTEVVKKMRSK